MDFTRELREKKFPSNGLPLKVYEETFILLKVMCEFTNVSNVNLLDYLVYGHTLIHACYVQCQCTVCNTVVYHIIDYATYTLQHVHCTMNILHKHCTM